MVHNSVCSIVMIPQAQKFPIKTPRKRIGEAHLMEKIPIDEQSANRTFASNSKTFQDAETEGDSGKSFRGEDFFQKLNKNNYIGADYTNQTDTDFDWYNPHLYQGTQDL